LGKEESISEMKRELLRFMAKKIHPNTGVSLFAVVAFIALEEDTFLSSGRKRKNTYRQGGKSGVNLKGHSSTSRARRINRTISSDWEVGVVLLHQGERGDRESMHKRHSIPRAEKGIDARGRINLNEKLEAPR